MPEAEKRTDPDEQLADIMVEYYADPLGFVLFAFKWNEGDLLGFDGPDVWQADTLKEIGRLVKDRSFNGIDPVDSIRMATASGHGVGKSALTAWIVLWLMSTRPFCKGIVTANTSSQLETKTWAELAKWAKRCITGHWFRVSSGKMSMKIVQKDHPETWRCDAQTCREENSESFAGQHAANSTPFYIFDEASAIPDVIWDVAEGGLTDGEPMWFAFGNPTRNTGRFRECFGRFKHRWVTRQIDSRKAKLPNKEQIDEWISDYGSDSDFVRVRVKGEFPRAGSMQFISSELVEQAADQSKEQSGTLYDPLILGVDVARYGDDKTVFRFRRGRDARSISPIKLRGVDTMQVAAKIAELHEHHQFDAIFIDGGGPGGGVVDRCRYLRLPVTEIQFGASADRETMNDEGKIVFANKRAEIWGLMREWLKGGMIDDDPELKADLTGVEYGYVMKDGKDAILLEKKEHMKKRGLASPDDADALALTFSYPIGYSDHSQQFGGKPSFQAEYDPFAKVL